MFKLRWALLFVAGQGALTWLWLILDTPPWSMVVASGIFGFTHGYACHRARRSDMLRRLDELDRALDQLLRDATGEAR